MTAAEAIVAAARIWGIVGSLVALAFLTVGIDRIDEDSRGAYAFRPLLVPAVLLIWPLVLWRWWVLEAGRDQWPKRYRPPRKPHLSVAVTLLVCIVFTVVAGIAVRQTWPTDFEPQQVSLPQKVGQ